MSIIWYFSRPHLDKNHFCQVDKVVQSIRQVYLCRTNHVAEAGESKTFKPLVIKHGQRIWVLSKYLILTFSLGDGFATGCLTTDLPAPTTVFSFLCHYFPQDQIKPRPVMFPVFYYTNYFSHLFRVRCNFCPLYIPQGRIVLGNIE